MSFAQAFHLYGKSLFILIREHGLMKCRVPSTEAELRAVNRTVQGGAHPRPSTTLMDRALAFIIAKEVDRMQCKWMFRDEDNAAIQVRNPHTANPAGPGPRSSPRKGSPQFKKSKITVAIQDEDGGIDLEDGSRFFSIPIVNLLAEKSNDNILGGPNNDVKVEYLLIDPLQTRAFNEWGVGGYLEYRVSGEKAYLVTESEHVSLALLEMKKNKESDFTLRYVEGDEPMDMEGFSVFQ